MDWLSAFSSCSLAPLGPVEIEGLIMSLASGLPSEINYALTTLTMITLLPLGRDNPNSGIPLPQCEDLLDTLIDLLEDTAFDEEEDEEEDEDVSTEDDADIGDARPAFWTRAVLFRQIEEQDTVQSSVAPRNRDFALKQDPASTILAIVNVLRNFLGHEANRLVLCSHTRLFDTLARISDVVMCEDADNARRWKPLSGEIKLNELVKIHSEMIALFSMLDLFNTHLAHLEQRTTRRIYNLLVSPLIDPQSSLEPRNIILPIPAPPQGRENAINVTSSMIIEWVLDAFVKLSFPDENRRVLANSGIIPHWLLKTHFQALVRMLPVTEDDFLATTPASTVAIAANLPPTLVAETLMGYVEKIVQCLHSLAFLASPTLKLNLRTQTPGLVQVLIRMAQFYASGVVRRSAPTSAPTSTTTTTAAANEGTGGVVIFGDLGQGHRAPNPPTGWIVVVRRIYELLSLLDSCADSFDPVPNTPLAFAPPPSRPVAAAATTRAPSTVAGDNSLGGKMPDGVDVGIGETNGSGSIGAGSESDAGLLAGRFSELLITSLLRDNNDAVAFQELDDLIRLGNRGGGDTIAVVY